MLSAGARCPVPTRDMAALPRDMQKGPPMPEYDSISHDLHPPHGTRGEFRKLTVTLSPVLFAQVLQESTRRKVAGTKHANTSAVIREALAESFSRRAG